MAIVVVCSGCKARFSVSEKFAGKQGPCPKCKAVITIPALSEQVKIHEPEQYGGAKDAKGRPVLKPLARVESKVHPVMVVGIVGAALLTVAIAWILGRSQLDAQAQWIVLAAGAVALAPPLVIAGYSFLRNQELEPYRGMSLSVRTAICSLVYAALWGAVAVAKQYLVPDGSATEMWTWLFLGGPPLAIGSITAWGCFDLDIGSGFFHYALYVVACVLLRSAMGLPAL